MALAKSAPDLTPWLNEVYGWRKKFPLGYDKPADGSVSPQYVIERIGKISGPDTIFAAGVGQHQMWGSPTTQLSQTFMNASLRKGG